MVQVPLQGMAEIVLVVKNDTVHTQLIPAHIDLVGAKGGVNPLGIQAALLPGYSPAFALPGPTHEVDFSTGIEYHNAVVAGATGQGALIYLQVKRVGKRKHKAGSIAGPLQCCIGIQHPVLKHLLSQLEQLIGMPQGVAGLTKETVHGLMPGCEIGLYVLIGLKGHNGSQVKLVVGKGTASFAVKQI